MAGRELSLFLKYPGSSIALQRLQHSFLECVVEHKSGTYDELVSSPPSFLRSAYQLKGSATLEDDELIISFTPKHPGLHTVRLFADTRELCKPVAFVVSPEGDIESTPMDKPVKQTSSLFRQVMPSPAPPSVTQQQQQQQQQQQIQNQLRVSQAFGTQAQRGSNIGGDGGGAGGYLQMQFGGGVRDSTALKPNTLPPQQQQQQQQQLSQDDGFFTTVNSDPVIPRQQLQDQVGGRAVGSMYQQQRFSHMTSNVPGTRPSSMMPAQEEEGFPGDLLSMTEEKSSFDQLYARRKAGEDAKIRRDFLMVDHNKTITPSTFESLDRDISKVVGNKGMKTRRRCSVCSKKVKMSKLVYLGDHDFCESCFKRQYAMRSAVDHFNVPMIRESAVDVPINKRGTKFISTRRTIPDVNLRGLEPAEVRYAQDEFKKFEMDSSGWIDKHVLFPLLKACFSSQLKDQEIKHLLSSQALKSLITSYGIDQRDEVHELEFLSLLAFIAREAISLKGIGAGMSKAKKFSPGDLQMAYAFQSKFGQGFPSKQAWGSDPGGQAQQISPTHLSPGHLPPTPQHHRLNTSSSPHHAPGYSSLGQPTYQDMNLAGQGRYPGPRGFQGSLSESYGGQMLQQPGADLAGQQRLNQSARYSGQGMQQAGGSPVGQTQQERDEQRMNMLLASAPDHRQSQLLPSSPPHHPQQSLGTSPEHEGQVRASTMQLYPLSGQQQQQQQQQQHQFPLQRRPMQNIEMLDASRTSAFSVPPNHPPPGPPGLQDLPEEDQEEPQELPTLPPNKDPERHTISLQKKQTNSKRIMQELKLTGDSADSWMMY